MTETRKNPSAGVPQEDYDRLERLIESADSPVGIDARKAHVIILHKLEQLEKRERELDRLLDRVTLLEERIPDAAAMTADILDEEIRRLREEGVDPEARVAALRRLLVKATEPGVLEALGVLADAAPALSEIAVMAERLPDFAALAADGFDEAYRDLEHRGIDMEAGVRRGMEAVLRLSQLIDAHHLDAMEQLLSSSILDPETLAVISRMADALKESRGQPPERVGPMGLVRALRDPDVQRATGFLVTFARKLGASLRE